VLGGRRKIGDAQPDEGPSLVSHSRRSAGLHAESRHDLQVLLRYGASRIRGDG
jgi:hypothetical protein